MTQLSSKPESIAKDGERGLRISVIDPMLASIAAENDAETSIYKDGDNTMHGSGHPESTLKLHRPRPHRDR